MNANYLIFQPNPAYVVEFPQCQNSQLAAVIQVYLTQFLVEEMYVRSLPLYSDYRQPRQSPASKNTSSL